ncbi:glutaminase A [Novosphingobium sp. G106]|uniref:glutaminase A n=1 Tax=Novosphingobium sp. G106 TaxID=2849500 RepID=UPI001C2D66EA|nr:glutaminase A [Novosphingobium sp. G106]MBV1689293.1 glutaminase A [Novosphingobium sp. G106]
MGLEDADAGPDNEFDRALQRAWAMHGKNSKGAVADYIPELSKANPDDFGLAIATSKGQLYTIGDAEVPFTIQSVSKAFAFCLALEIAGPQRVSSRVGVEPSGDPFNAIVFDPSTNRPFNPMVNAGAIAVAGILCDYLGKDAFEFLLNRFSVAAGRELSVDEAVYRSENETGHRNRAIAHLLLANGALSGSSPDKALDLYFRQCSISVTAVDLARMGATFANMGQSPLDKRLAFELTSVRRTLSVMFTCGMYDYAGHWAYDVGIPAKSGVGGGIVGVINRQLGIGSYSPRLDAKGNSVRGVASFETLAEEFGLHAFDCTNVGSSFISSLIR